MLGLKLFLIAKKLTVKSTEICLKTFSPSLILKVLFWVSITVEPSNKN